MMNGIDPGNRVLNGRAHWPHVTNTVERFCAAGMSGFATNRLVANPGVRLLTLGLATSLFPNYFGQFC